MASLALTDIRTVLCIGAHPDDIEIGCGGTILRLATEQPELSVHWLVLSGAGDRADEARESARVFLEETCSSTIAVHTFRDSLFPYDGEQIKETLRELSQDVSPDIVFTHRREDMHQDHRLVAELTWNVFRDHLIMEYEIPKYEGDLGAPNVFVVLDDETCHRKVDTIVQTFRSQATKPWFSEDTFWALLRLRGIECNSPTQFAEGLYCRKMTFR